MTVRACPRTLIRPEGSRVMLEMSITGGSSTLCPARAMGGIIEPFVREAGNGPGVVCIHANASTSGQWRGLMDLLAPRFRVFAPDSYDAGKSPHWPSDRVIRLRDEVALIEPVITRAGSPLALVG